MSCCQREGTRLICVTLADPEDWDDQMNLYDWGFSRYCTGNVTARLQYSLPVYGGAEEQICLRADPLPLFLPRDAELKLRVELPRCVLAPLRTGESCGRVSVFLDGEMLGSAALRFARDISASG